MVKDTVVKNIGCSSGGPRFNSQHPHDSSQPSITLVPGDLGTLFWPLWSPYTSRNANTYTHQIINNNENIKEKFMVFLRQGFSV